MPTTDLINPRGSDINAEDSGYLGFGTVVHAYKRYLSICFYMQIPLASQPVKWLSLGLGLTMATTATTTSRIFVSDFARGAAPLVSPEVDIGTTFVPQAAVSFEPSENLLISLMLHWKYSSPMTTGTEQQMWRIRTESLE